MNAPATAPRKPRTSAPEVRGFLNMSVAVPDLGVVTQSEIVGKFEGGGKGLLYGDGNAVPAIALAAGQQSGTAYRCLERRAQFLEGEGFPVPARDSKTGKLLNPVEAGTMGEFPVPGQPGKTANDFWAELCSYGGWFNGDAVLVRYKDEEGNHEIGETHVLPFGSVRKTSKGTLLLNHKFGRKGYSKSDTTEHRLFNPDPAVVKAEMEADKLLADAKKKPYVQLGQIFFIHTPKAGEEDYPLPPHWAGLEAVLTDAAYSRFDLEEVEGGFSAKGILVLKGKADTATPDENNRTEAEREDAELGLFTNSGARAQGVKRKSILVMEAETQESVPAWIPMNTTIDLKWLSDKKEAVGQEVCRHIGIPPILAGFARAGQLAATQEIVNATQLTQNSLEPLRKLLLRAFWRLFPTLAGIVPGKLNPVVVAAEATQAPR